MTAAHAEASREAPLGYVELAPPARLRAAVECVWVRRTEETPRAPYRVLPDGCADLVFDLSPAPSLGDGERTGLRAVAVGAMTAPLVVEGSARSTMLGVRFLPGRALPFFGTRLDELTDRRVGLEALWGPAGARLAERLLAGRGPVDWLATLDDELPPAVTPDAAVARAAAWVVAREGRVRIGDLARRFGVARQTLARRFRRQVGLGPKTFARVARLRATVARLERAPEVDWAALAAEQGFADQAHLCSELRVLAGERPGALWRRLGVPFLQDEGVPAR